MSACVQCKFYNPKGPGAGECRRNAPRPDRTFDGAASMRWPQVSRDAWCGEYIRRPDPRKNEGYL